MVPAVRITRLPFSLHRIPRSFLCFCLLLLFGTGAAMGRAKKPSALSPRVLIVYNGNNSDSVSVAKYYAAQRAVPSANLCKISPPKTDTLTWTQYLSSVKTPVRNCLNAVGASNILYIVFTYQTPYTLTALNGQLYALDQYVADIWDLYNTRDAYPFPNKLQPYYADAQSQGNVYQPFTSFADYRAQNSAISIYSVWRLDAPTAALAKGLVDKAIAAESSGLHGQACLDRMNGAMSKITDSDYGEGEWDLHKAAVFAGQAGFSVTEDSNNAEFGTPPAPNCPGAALYSGWYSLNHYNDAFTWNTGAIGWHLDSSSAPNPRAGPNWSANAIIKGITVTTGSVAEPQLQGLVRPGGTFRDLFQGASVGDAFLRNTRWLKWMILYLGDPLYRPFPNGLPPFNPPAPQASLGLSPRYFLNASASTGTVTLAAAAPPGGTLVPLSSSGPSLVQVPASVTVPAGQTSVNFTANSAASPLVTSDNAAVISATGVGQNTLTVWPLLAGDVVAPTNIIGGAPATGTVVLNADAPNGGVVVSLSGDGNTTLPPNVTVPQGASQADFSVGSQYVTAKTVSPINATLNIAQGSVGLTLQPALLRLDFYPPAAPGGSNATAAVTLGAPAPPAGWPVNLGSSNPQVASVPSQVTVPAGSGSAQVPITSTPQCNNVGVTITASSGASRLSGTFTVTPPPVTTLYFPSNVVGGNNVSATVYLSNPACSAGQPVSLTSSNPPVASVPPTVTVPAGQTSTNFTIATTHANSQTQVTISATSDNVMKTRVLTVTP